VQDLRRRSRKIQKTIGLDTEGSTFSWGTAEQLTGSTQSPPYHSIREMHRGGWQAQDKEHRPFTRSCCGRTPRGGTQSTSQPKGGSGGWGRGKKNIGIRTVTRQNKDRWALLNLERYGINDQARVLDKEGERIDLLRPVSTKEGRRLAINE